MHAEFVGADAGTAAMAEMPELDAEVLRTFLAGLITWLGDCPTGNPAASSTGAPAPAPAPGPVPSPWRSASRFLPEDVGVGRPGMAARLHAALKGGPAPDRTDHLVRAGFVLEAERPFVIDLPAPLPPATARYAQVCLRKPRSHLDGRFPAEDLAALDAVTDDECPHSVLRRDDLTVRTIRTTWVGRRP